MPERATSTTRTLSTAGQRRTTVLAAAVATFAQTGYRGTSVAAVAAAAGISEAYVFRLFGGKQDLFIAALRHCFQRIHEALAGGADEAGHDGAEGGEPGQVLAGMAGAYARLIAERELLMLQVHALAVSDNPAIQAELREAQRGLVEFAQERSGASDGAVQEFFARGQLCHLVTALGIVGPDPEAPVSPGEPWVRILTAGIRHYPAADR